jgi:RHS repeat-associated protein
VTAASDSSGQVGAYDYDGFGRRTHESISGTNYEFIFDLSGRPYEEVSGKTAKQTELYAGRTHVGVYAAGTTYFSSINWLGTETRHTLPGGTNASTCTDYLPFGDGADCTGDIQTSNQPQFTGQWTDYETSGNVHMSNRYYEAIEGRFTTPDPAGAAAVHPRNPQTWNQYAYVANNPLRYVDPSGLDGTDDDNGDDNNGPCNNARGASDCPTGGAPVNPNADSCPYDFCTTVTAAADQVQLIPVSTTNNCFFMLLNPCGQPQDQDDDDDPKVTLINNTCQDPNSFTGYSNMGTISGTWAQPGTVSPSLSDTLQMGSNGNCVTWGSGQCYLQPVGGGCSTISCPGNTRNANGSMTQFKDQFPVQVVAKNCAKVVIPSN